MSNLESAVTSAREFLAKNSAHGQSQTTCLYISALLDAIDKRDGEIERRRAALEFVRTDPCFGHLGSVTHDTVTDALGLTNILSQQKPPAEELRADLNKIALDTFRGKTT